MSQNKQHQEMKVLLHAPTPTGLERARNNAANLKRAQPEAQVRIIANAQAVVVALDVAHPELDALTWICPNTLRNINRENRVPLNVLADPAIVEMVRLQQEGWVYIRS